MTVALLRRAGWAISAAFFALVLASTFFLDHVPAWATPLFFALAALAAWRPASALQLSAVLTPVVWYTARPWWNTHVRWAEVVAVSVVLGWSLRRCTARDERDATPYGVAAMALAAIVIAATLAAVAAERMQLGPQFAADVGAQITRHFFSDFRSFPGLHAGVRLMEGLVLFAAAAATSRADPRFTGRLSVFAAVGGALAAFANIAELVRAAADHPSFWPALANNLLFIRYNVPYGDLNAAGSYFVLVAIVAAGAALAASGVWRVVLTLCAALAAAGLWISGSRAAMLAGVVGIAAAAVAYEMRRRGRAVAPALATGGAAILLVILLALYLPLRGNQHSSAIAVEVRTGMAAAGMRMIASRPLLGIGLSEFSARAGEFVTPELVALFPVATHENAHNNFIQVAAELGLPGLVLFVLLLATALIAASRGALGDPLRSGLVLGLAVFLLTCLGGHPLLIYEVTYTFFLLLGAAAGAGATRLSTAWRIAAAIVVVLALASTPLRVRALEEDADLEHVGVGVSLWQSSPDGIRYREATDTATLFVPAESAIALSVEARSDRPVHLELRLDGRLADLIVLEPGRWTDIALPVRTTQQPSRYSQLQLRVTDRPGTRLWITKVRPVQ